MDRIVIVSLENDPETRWLDVWGDRDKSGRRRRRKRRRGRLGLRLIDLIWLGMEIG